MEMDLQDGWSSGKLQGGRMGIRPQGALVLNHFGTVELVRKKTILGFREGETSLERAIAAEKVSDCLRGGVCVCVCVCVCAQLCLTLCNPMGYSPPASSVHGILQTRILEWVAISFSRGIFPTQGSNPSLLYWQMDSLPLHHEGDFVIGRML